MNGFSIYDHYLACTQFRPGEWVAVPDYLERWNDALLQEFIMLHDPYLFDYEQLSVERCEDILQRQGHPPLFRGEGNERNLPPKAAGTQPVKAVRITLRPAEAR